MTFGGSRRLEGRTAIVTGAGRGLGRAEALLLAGQGAAVVVNDVGRHDDGGLVADSVVEEIRGGGGRAEANHDSVTEAASAAAMVETAMDVFGGLDIVINNAGVISIAVVESLPDEEWNAVIDTHLRGSFLLIKKALPGFKRQRSGVIINTASDSGLGHPTASHYSAAKEGIVGLTRSVAREIGGFGVRCNAVRPWAANTRLSVQTRTESEPWRTTREQLGRYRIGERGHHRATNPPEAVAPMVVWLCTDAAAHLNGYTFGAEGTLVGVWSEPALYRSMAKPDGWDLDALDTDAPQFLTYDLDNRFHAQFEA